jgi:predicted esterase YcpF (UPF0227 family)
MVNKTQVARIQKMEQILDEGIGIVLELEQALDKYESFADKIDELEQYYTGEQWQKDFADDEAGKLPRDLKRGVLSEDAVYDFLALRDQVLERIKNVKK